MGVEPPHRVGAEGPIGVIGAVEPQALETLRYSVSLAGVFSEMGLMPRDPRVTRDELYQRQAWRRPVPPEGLLLEGGGDPPLAPYGAPPGDAAAWRLGPHPGPGTGPRREGLM